MWGLLRGTIATIGSADRTLPEAMVILVERLLPML